MLSEAGEHILCKTLYNSLCDYMLAMDNCSFGCTLIVVWRTDASVKMLSLLVVAGELAAATVVADFSVNSAKVICTIGAYFIPYVAHIVTISAPFCEKK